MLVRYLAVLVYSYLMVCLLPVGILHLLSSSELLISLALKAQILANSISGD